MKKKIQKYLAGEREGFSLVELIIVIAIMAILIGVIALAVIPNIQRSRESKDLTTLDNVLSAANTAVANAKISVTGTDTHDITLTKANSYAVLADGATGGGPTGFKQYFDESMAGTIALGSAPVKDETIHIFLSAGKIEVYVAPKSGGTSKTMNGKSVAVCERTASDTSTGNQAFYVSN